MPVMREIKTPLALFKIRYFQDEKGLYYKKKGGNHRRQVKPFWKMKRLVLGIPVMILLILGFVGYKIGINLASEKMIDELASQIPKEEYDKILKDPNIQQIIDKQVGAGKKSELLKNISADPAIKETVYNDTAGTKVNTINEKQPSATNPDPSKEEQPAATTDANNDKDTSGKKDNTEVKPPATKAKPAGLQFSSNEEVMGFLLSKFSTGELSALAKKAQGGVTAQEKAEIKNTVLSRISTEEYNALKVYAVVEVSKRQ